jgi:hypothetical protein
MRESTQMTQLELTSAWKVVVYEPFLFNGGRWLAAHSPQNTVQNRRTKHLRRARKIFKNVSRKKVS